MEPRLIDLCPVDTERLSIRPLTADDAAALRAITDDQAITDPINFLSSPFTLADARALIGGMDEENCYLGVWRRRTLVGVIGVHVRTADQLEVGYWFGKAFQGLGYGFEAVSKIIDQLRLIYPALQIAAECRRANERSWHLLHKLGFRPSASEGTRPGRELLLLPRSDRL